MKGLIFLLALPLAACNTAGDTAHVDSASTIVYKTVNVPVPQPCPVTKPARPGDAKTHGLARPLPTDPAALVDLLLAKLKEWDGLGKYADQAEGSIDICIRPIPPALR